MKAIAIDDFATAVVKGELSVPVDRTYELHEAGQALRDFTTGKRGKLAIAVGHPRETATAGSV
jgi:hypothetical protein